MALNAGTTLGPYEIEAPLGAGGMGEVYKARDTRLDRIVAIKVLPEHVANDPALKQRFEREARTVAALNHPHICTLHDIGTQEPSTSSGQAVDYIVMEYLDGDTLAQRLVQGALPLNQALTVATEIADALDKAHRQGIVHRDLKPANIMLTKAGAKLLDFGLAKSKPTERAWGLSALATQSAGLTGEGKILGTLQYMAPEQLEGKEADARTDIFAFGATLYEMVTGQKAFIGDSQASLIGAILKDEPQLVSALQPMSPDVLDYVVKTCLAKEPDDRWQSAGDVGRQVRGIIESGSHARLSVPVTVAPGRTSWRARSLVATGFVVALVTGLVVWSMVRPEPSPPRPMSQFVITMPPGGRFLQSGSPEVALSPDGTQIVFGGGSRNFERRLYLRPVSQPEATPIPGTEAGQYPFFSPNGEWVGFFTQTDSQACAGRICVPGTLKKVPVLGGAPVTISNLSADLAAGGPGSLLRGASWGLDDTIVFATTRSMGLMQVSAVGGEPAALTTVDREKGETGHLWPEVLPNGIGVLFTVLSDSGPRIALLSYDTDEVTYVGPVGSHPRYSPSGHVVYQQGRALWAVGFDQDRLELTAPTPVRVLENVASNAGNAGNFRLSDDGSLVYLPTFVTNAQERRFVWVDHEGRE